MNVILVGYMGSGKTTLGKKLAARLGLTFMDTDKIIEEKEAQSVDALFATKGETYFRQLEQALVEELKQLDHVLIATGGGMPCYNNLMEELKTIGFTIYLKRPAKELAHRVKNSKKIRPLLRDKNEEELLAYMEEMLQKRAPYYEQAHLIVDREVQAIASLELQIKALTRNWK